jgi:molybdate/tungstate transport system substrate-binding protein
LQEKKAELKVFHAGSLIVPFEELENEFEEKHPNVDVQRESSGSVEAVRKITGVGKVAEVIALADYSLIPDMMMPEYANWCIRFAKNDMVLAYTDKSNYADKITGDNWYKILQKDVRFGFSNPNLDPCGYRTPMVFKLAELHYNTNIFDLITDNTAITINKTDGTYLIKSPEHLEPRGKVTIRDKSVDLVHLVKAGEIDYAFEYRSVAVQHGLKFVDLPMQIDLSDVEYEDLYKKVKLMDATGKIRTGKSIVYGITVPNNAINKELGIEFVKLLISEEGQDILRRFGQTPIIPAEPSGNVPEELASFVKKTLKLATGSPYELGLIDALAKPFEEKYDCIVEVTKASTGQGLDLGRKGKVDLALGHSREAFDTYIEEGYGTDRQAVMHNYFVIVGRVNDPAGIRGISNLTEVHKMIANTNSLYLSRGDEGGMHKREKAIWDELGIDPSKEDWYLASHAFMMASLRMANEVGTYHMADSSTWTVMRDELSSLDLLVIGDPNRYEATAVNPEKYSNVNYGLAKAFIEYITLPEGQTIIGDFGIDKYGEPLYYPDAILQMEVPTDNCLIAYLLSFIF